MKTACLMCCFSIAACLTVAANAQSLDWSRQYGTSQFDLGSGVSVDSAGNVVTVGSVPELIEPFSSTDILITKYDSAGNLLWDRALGTTDSENGNDIFFDSAGNVIVSGRTTGDLFATSFGYFDAVVAKYDADGNFLWGDQFGTTSAELGWTVTADPTGNVIVCGNGGGDVGGTNQGSNDVYMRKYDSTGGVLWTIQFGTSSSDFVQDVTTDAAGNIYLTGSTSGPLKGDRIGITDSFVRKHDPDGNHIWTRKLGQVNEVSEGMGIQVDGSDDIFVAGQTGDVSTWKNGFLAKYDSSGNFQWQSDFGSSEFDSVTNLNIDADGNLLVGGFTEGDLSGTNQGMDDAFVGKFDSSGNNLWYFQVGTPEDDHLWELAAGPNGGMYFTGNSKGDLFDTNLGQSDIFTAKLVEPLPVTPQGQKLLDGIVTAGQMSDVFDSDDVYLEMDPSPTSNLAKQIVDVVYQSEFSTDTPGSLKILVEAKMLGTAVSGDVIQTVSFFNYQTNKPEMVDTRPVEVIDTLVEIIPGGDISRFIGPVHNEVTVQVSWRSPEFSGSPFTWSIDLDQAIWVIE